MALSRARVMRGEMPDDVDLEMLSYLPAWMYTFAGIPNSRNRHSIYSRLLIAPPRSGLRSAIRAGGHGTTLKKLLRRARDRIQPSNSTYFQGARLTTRVSSRRPSWTGSHARMSAAEPCKVCKAKRAGTAPPKRKCTCDSGTTVQRNRVSASAAVPARAEREPPMWQAIPGLFDELLSSTCVSRGAASMLRDIAVWCSRRTQPHRTSMTSSMHWTMQCKQTTSMSYRQ